MLQTLWDVQRFEAPVHAAGGVFGWRAVDSAQRQVSGTHSVFSLILLIGLRNSQEVAWLFSEARLMTAPHASTLDVWWKLSLFYTAVESSTET